MEWYDKAVAAGEERAAVRKAVLYRDGVVVSQNQNEYRRIVEEEKRKNNKHMRSHIIADLLDSDNPELVASGLEYAKLWAEQNEPMPCEYLSAAYFYGLYGLEKNLELAIKYAKIAAKEYIDSIIRIADYALYDLQNNEMAIELYIIGADYKNVYSMRCLGDIYKNMSGDSLNDIAYDWYYKCIQEGKKLSSFSSRL